MTETEGQQLLHENAELRAQVASLTKKISELVEQIARSNDRVAELLAVAQRRHRKPSPPKPPEPPAEIEGDAKKAFDKRPKPPSKPLRPKPEKKPRRPSGRKPLPTHPEMEEHAFRPDRCAQCGGTALDAAEEVVEEKLHIIKEHQRRRVVRRMTCRCRDCGVRTTRLPPFQPRTPARR